MDFYNLHSSGGLVLQKYNNAERQKILECFAVVDELVSGKFILFDIKAEALMQIIASSENLYSLFAKCLMDYDFWQDFRLGEEYKKLQGFFRVPQEEHILAFVFCLILEINNGKINLRSFIDRNFFNPNGYNYSYLDFARAILVPFRTLLMAELGVEEADEDDEEEQMEMELIDKELENNKSEDKILYANLLFALNELHAAVANDRKIKKDIKDEEYIVILGLLEAVKLENIKVLNALIISLEYILGKQKTVKKEYDEVKKCMIAIYDSFKK